MTKVGIAIDQIKLGNVILEESDSYIRILGSVDNGLSALQDDDIVQAKHFKPIMKNLIVAINALAMENKELRLMFEKY